MMRTKVLAGLALAAILTAGCDQDGDKTSKDAVPTSGQASVSGQEGSLPSNSPTEPLGSASNPPGALHTPAEGLDTTPLPESKQAEAFGIRIGEAYPVKGSFGVKEEPENIVTASGFRTKPDETYTVIELKGPYARIEADGKSGWLPTWYLTKEAEKIRNGKPKLMLVPAAGPPLYLYPESSASTDPLPLEGGRVVQVTAEFGDWMQVEFCLFEAADYGDRWMKKADLSPYRAEDVKEGLLRAGGSMYDDKGNATQEQPAYPLMISEALSIEGKGDFYRVYGPAGFTGLIRQADFFPNPFQQSDIAGNVDSINR
ncbi:SH3 domain-containing protein [Gorillibacterium timonense]|uniref:hypothetical protein n=1 Tax=Gorillibacterium timonense TaxID=1689269 RepID=UPI0011DE323C|nr:hypothetical protein [Gorillibacterium timonense]